jgi:glycosyltransferase involved in cell wall biosynthesis
MKVLFISSVFPSPLRPNNGAFNAVMIRGLAAEDEVTVVAPVPWPVAYRAYRDGSSGQDVRDAKGVEVRHPIYFYTPKILRGQYGRFFEWSIAGAVNDVLSRFQPQLVMGYWSHPDGHAAVRIAQRLGVPGIVMVGGTDVLVLGKDVARQRAIRQVLDRADSVVAVSHDLKRALGHWGCNTGKIHVVRRGVDTARFNPGPQLESRARIGIPRDGKAILWVGHMVPVKGLDVLIEACANAAAVSEFHVYLVGDGTLRPRIEARIAELSLRDRITCVGYVAHDDLADWYRAVDLTVLPSQSEGIPNVLLESIACGTPFVASHVGGIPEIADPLIDRLVTPGDVTALAHALVTTLAAPSRLPRRTMPVSDQESATRLREVLLAAVAARYRAAPRDLRTVGAAEAQP